MLMEQKINGHIYIYVSYTNIHIYMYLYMYSDICLYIHSFSVSEPTYLLIRRSSLRTPRRSSLRTPREREDAAAAPRHC